MVKLSAVTDRNSLLIFDISQQSWNPAVHKASPTTNIFKGGTVSGHRPQNYNLLFPPHPSPAVTPPPEGEGFETHPIRETAVHKASPTTNIFKGGTVRGHRPQNYNLLFSPHPSPAVTPSPEGEGFETHPIRETAVHEASPTTNIFKGGTVSGHRPQAELSAVTDRRRSCQRSPTAGGTVSGHRPLLLYNAQQL